QAGDTLSAIYADAFTSSGGAATRTAAGSVGGGADGTVAISADTLPGNDMTITLSDADLAGNGSMAVTVVNDVTGESETVTLMEIPGSPGAFEGSLATVFGVNTGTDDDGALTTQAGDTVTVSYDDALTAAGGAELRTAVGNIVGGTDGTVSITPNSVPGDPLTISVTDADMAGSGSVVVTLGNDVTGETESVILAEDPGSPGTFIGALDTSFGNTPGTSDDGTLVTQAGDTVTVTYVDEFSASGAPADRTATSSVGGGADGTVTITPNSVPGDVLDVTVIDSDLAGSGLVSVTVVNDTTGESETLALVEDAGSPGTFAGNLATVFGTGSGSDDDGTLNTQAGDTVTVTYNDLLTASGGSADLTAVDTVAGGADGTISITPTSIPGDTLSISVADPDLAGSGTISVTVNNEATGESETISLTEDTASPGTFTGNLPTAFGVAAGVDGDGVMNTQAADTVVASYEDVLTVLGGATTRTSASDVIGGADGAVEITETSVPGETLDLLVQDADLIGAGSVLVTVVNQNTGESESITLFDDGANAGRLSGTLITEGSAGPGSDDDGILVTRDGDTLIIEYLDALTGAGDSAVRTDVGEVSSFASLAGTAWIDADFDGQIGADEERLAGWVVELVLDGQSVASGVTLADGGYSFGDVLALPGYEVRLRQPGSGAVFRVVSDIALDPGNDNAAVNLPAYPTGVVYDAITRTPLPGARLIFTDSSDAALPEACLLPGQQNQITGDGGSYRFDLLADADPACPSDSEIRIYVDGPDEYADGRSALLPAQNDAFDPTGLPGPVWIAESPEPPDLSEQVLYHLSFRVAAGDPDFVNNHIPLDPLGVDPLTVRLAKTVASPEAVIGDLVQYRLELQNTGPVALNGLSVVDMPAPGFSFVEGSARFGDGSEAPADGARPVEFSGIDLAAGESVTLTYLTRVGAGVTRGDYENRATPYYGGARIGNDARAVVTIGSDPDFEQATIIGKVFNDIDGDGWQDSARATGVVLSGLPLADTSFAGGLTIDFGDGPRPLDVAIGSSPGSVMIGTLSGRAAQSEIGTVSSAVVRMRLRTDQAGGDLLLSSAEGSRLRLTPTGSLFRQHVGAVARGETAQDLFIERSVMAVDGGQELVVRVSNRGVDEIGIPGVRVATLNGLLAETDPYGRYHLAAIDVERFDRGRNFYVKVDPSTLPEGSEFTTANPRTKRITQGLMSRFNFGVRLPATPAPQRIVRMRIGEFFFDERSEEIRQQYRHLLTEIAEQVDSHSRSVIEIDGYAGTCPAGADRPDEVVFSPHFPVLGAELTDADRAALDRIMADWSANVDLTVEVIGHTSSVPIAAHNRHIFADNYALSEARAAAVSGYIVERLGISPERVTSVGRGPDEPVAANDTEAGRALNRRVELRIQGIRPGAECIYESYDARELAERRSRRVHDELLKLVAEDSLAKIEIETVHASPSTRVLLSASEATGRVERASADSAQQKPADDRLEPLYRPDPAMAIDRTAAGECTVLQCDSEEGLIIRTRAHAPEPGTGTASNSEADPANRLATVDGQFSVRLPEGGVLWATEDPAILDPRLAVKGPGVIHPGPEGSPEPVIFSAYTNYASFIRELQLHVYRETDVDRVDPLAVLTSEPRSLTSFQWDEPYFPGTEVQLTYVLYAIGHDGQRDETIPQGLSLAPGGGRMTTATDDGQFTDEGEISSAAASAAAVYGQSALVRQNIPIAGSRVRIFGQALGDGYRLAINGESLPIDTRERFAIEYFLPVGAHDFLVELTDPDGEVSQHTLSVDVTGRYMFLAALADITASGSDVSGSIEPLSADDSYDDDLLMEGRLAVYLKGKIKGRYLITAQVDTREEKLSDIFKDLHRKDQESVFRQLDPDRYYPVYGDDSTTISDTDSQGRMYVRVDWDKSQVLWGNYNTGLTATEFAQYNRSLYGARALYRSVDTTELGEARTRVQAFASEARTVLGHDEFLGTGGSLYYLSETDIVRGSDKAWIEVRDTETGRVLETMVLTRGVDYEIDALHGRIILAQPLMQITRRFENSIVRIGPLD
ncbi:MAG: OmpA family protein, partial [Gammaproteobacteria bacterium]